MLEIKNLNVAIESSPILKDFNLKIGSGEVHVIMGPNGSGKSTLSKVLAGHPDYEITGGEILFEKDFDSISLLELEPYERSLNGIFLANQYPVEIPGISNLDFLHAAYNKHCKHQGAEEIELADFENRALKELKGLNLSPQFLYRALNEGFSGGEKKRNEILQMLLLQPKFCVLDETDSGLDIDSLKVVCDNLNSYKSSDRSFLMITHYKRILDFIKPDFIHIVKDGKIIKSGGIELADQLEESGYEKI